MATTMTMIKSVSPPREPKMTTGNKIFSAFCPGKSSQPKGWPHPMQGEENGGGEEKQELEIGFSYVYANQFS